MRPLVTITRATTGLIAFAVLLSAAACARTGPAQPAQDLNAAFEQRAIASIDAWTKSGVNNAWLHGFVPLQDLTLPDGEPGFSDATKIAFVSGWYRLAAPLLLPPPSPGHIKFPDGTSMAVPLVNAEDAYQQIDQGDAPCQSQIVKTGPSTPSTPVPPTPAPSTPDGVTSTSISTPCVNLVVTQINLGTVQLRTSRGQAQVPAWLFTVPQLKVPIARVAVAPSAITPMPSVNNQLPGVGGLVGALDLVSVTGNTITFRLGVGACDRDIKPLVYETDDAVAVGGSVHTVGNICNDMLKVQPETVTLAAPLGDRVILDALSATPLVISTWP